MFAQVVDDGPGDAGVLAVVVPGDGVATGNLVDMEGLTEVLLASEFLYKQRIICAGLQLLYWVC